MGYRGSRQPPPFRFCEAAQRDSGVSHNYDYYLPFFFLLTGSGSAHLNDLKSITEDILYETYRTEKLSRSPDSNIRDSQILPSELATQSVRIKEEQLRREEEKVR